MSKHRTAYLGPAPLLGAPNRLCQQRQKYASEQLLGAPNTPPARAYREAERRLVPVYCVSVDLRIGPGDHIRPGLDTRTEHAVIRWQSILSEGLYGHRTTGHVSIINRIGAPS